MPPLVLFCISFGDDSLDRPFIVEIEDSSTVLHLQKAIKEEKKLDFDNIQYEKLDLFKTSIPFDDPFFEEKLNNLDLRDEARLKPWMMLSSIFAPTTNRLHVVVRVLRLNCYVQSTDPFNYDHVFAVQISYRQSIGALKKAIKDSHKPAFQHIDVNAFALWKVSFPVDESIQENLSNHEFGDEKRLPSAQRLSKVFSEPLVRENLHIVVTVPPTVIHPVTAAENLATLRMKFLQGSHPMAPSSAGDPNEFSKRQENPDQMIYCNRPRDASAPVPVTLLHPVFGRFIDDCENYKPTAEDNAFVLELSKVMPGFYPDESKRAESIRQSFRDIYHIDFMQNVIAGTAYSTDGDVGDKDNRNMPYALIEFINDIGSKGSEPLLQSIHYYLESNRTRAPEMLSSVFPCMIIIVFGPYMCFVGAAWTDRPVSQVLSFTIPFYFDFSDTRLRAIAARHLGAFKNAIHFLQDCYSNDLSVTNPSVPLSNSTSIPGRIFPYRKHFTSLVDSSKQHFEYMKQHEHYRLLFFGKLSDGRDICIKFARHYSQEVHSFCASKGFAPELLGFEEVPGGWWMVVMEQIDENHVQFRDLGSNHISLVLEHLRRFLKFFHENGFVHGDIRDTNIMVPRSGGAHFFLVDFDWGGKIGEVRYPMNVNRNGLWRPDGATDGELITAEHDDEMLKRLHMDSTISIPQSASNSTNQQHEASGSRSVDKRALELADREPGTEQAKRTGHVVKRRKTAVVPSKRVTRSSRK